MRILFLSFLAGLICFFSISLEVKEANAADQHTVNGGGTTVQITEHSYCRRITNNNTPSIMVPSKTNTEWSSFYNNAPPSVVATNCNCGAQAHGSSWYVHCGDAYSPNHKYYCCNNGVTSLCSQDCTYVGS